MCWKPIVSIVVAGVIPALSIPAFADETAIGPLAVRSNLNDSATPSAADTGLIEVRWDALQAAAQRNQPIVATAVPIGGGRTARLTLTASPANSIGTRFVVGSLTGRDQAFELDSSQVVLLRGQIDGRPDSYACLAVSPRAVVGSLWLGDGERPRRIQTRGSQRSEMGGLIASVEVVNDAPTMGGLTAPLCGVIAPDQPVNPELNAGADDPGGESTDEHFVQSRADPSRARKEADGAALETESGVEIGALDDPLSSWNAREGGKYTQPLPYGYDSDRNALVLGGSDESESESGIPCGSPAGLPIRKGLRVIELAVDTDYPYYAIFNDREAAGLYVLLLYGTLSEYYIREVNAEFRVVYVRLWQSPDDPYRSAADPLSRVPYKGIGVDYDAVQLCSGRRNLPYGGVAYVGALCGGASVVGYIQGWFPDPEQPSVWNWDLFVTGHELGHNCGVYHTSDYGLDDCPNVNSTPQRGGFMAYCSQTVSGGNSVSDLRFETPLRKEIAEELKTSCLFTDCNRNGVADSSDISAGYSEDVNRNGTPDECEDCNGNDVLDDKDILDKTSKDVNSNKIPDECEPDCNGNGQPDDVDITKKVSKDERYNGIPDECEDDCDGDGLSDFVEINADMTLDRNRNRTLDACEDCDADGVPDLEQFPHLHTVWVANSKDNVLREFHGLTGVRMQTGAADQLSEPNDVLITPDRRVLVTSGADHRVVEFDLAGGFVRDLVPAGAGGLANPGCMVIAPDGALLVASTNTDNILAFDLNTGDMLAERVTPGSGGLIAPFGLALHPNGGLFVGGSDNQVREYDALTGEFRRVFVSDTDNGGLSTPRGMTFKHDGNLLVCSLSNRAVLEYDGTTGAFVRQFNSGGTNNELALTQPWCVRVGPDRQIYVSRRDDRQDPGPWWNGDDHHLEEERRAAGDPVQLHVTTARIYAYDAVSGAYLRAYVVGNDTGLFRSTGFAFVPGDGDDCNVNFLPDGCDLADGRSADLDADGVPDECQVDCDGNGIADRLELLPFGPQRDCNFNGFPDSCDLRDRTSRDCDGDGVPDECQTTTRWAFYDNFEFSTGWTIVRRGATAGLWARGVPVNDPDYSYDPAHDSDGSGQCFLTANSAGESDVDKGAVELTSPVMDLAGGEPLIRFDYFLRLSDTKDGVDRLLVEISTNDLNGPWVEVARYDQDGGDQWHAALLNQHLLDRVGVEPSSKTRLRFTANDADPQSIVEAGIDAVRITVTQRPCPIDPGDLNCDGRVDFDDINAFVGALIGPEYYSSQFPYCEWRNADLDKSGAVDFDDIDGFVTCLINGACK